MPYKYKADQKAYEKRRNATPARRKARAMNVQARRKMAKRYGESAIKGKDVDHIRPISQGGTNALRNLRAVSKRRNRGNRSNVKRRRTVKKN
jgi:5-methylcytosine-specific restriction endonuclease McrA